MWVFKYFFTFFIHNQLVFICAKNFIFVILSWAFSMTSVCWKNFHLCLIVFYHNTNYFAYFCFSSLYILLKSFVVKITHSANFRCNHYHIKLIFAFGNYLRKYQGSKFSKNYENNFHYFSFSSKFQNLLCLVGFKFKWIMFLIFDLLILHSY